MKNALILGFLAVACSVATSQTALAQSQQDWYNLGRAIRGAIEQSQGYNNNMNSGRPARSYEYSPNQSGSSNQGSFYNPFGGGGFNNNSGFNNNNYYRPQSSNYYRPQSSNYYRPSSSYYDNSSSYRSVPPVAPRVYSNRPISIYVPEWCSGACRYSLVSATGREYPYTIYPGQRQEFKENTDWKVRYYTGSGYRTYDLDGGYDYEFRSSGSNWSFYRSR